MDAGSRYGILTLVALAVPAAAQGAAAAPSDTLPQGVTAAQIQKGKTIFTGDGLCFACHGPDAKGTVGPNLTDATWLHGKGTYPEIVDRIMKGVFPDESKTGQVMPPRGGSSINDEQVRAVAAYVWSLSHKGSE